MSYLYSQYISGGIFTPGNIIGSQTGVSGINAVVDRLNSISSDNNLVIGSLISGTTLNCFISGGEITNAPIGSYDIVNVAYSSNIGKIVNGSQINYKGALTTTYVSFGSIPVGVPSASNKVLLMSSAAGSSVATDNIRVQFSRDAVVLFNQDVRPLVGGDSYPINLFYVDTPGVGSYWYHIQHRTDDNNAGNISGGIFTAIQL